MIKEITHLQALEFFLDHKGWEEKVTFTDKGGFFGAFKDGELCGICSTQQIGKWTRIKSLLVAKKWRRKGISSELVRFASAEKCCTAFAFNSSFESFKRAGFVHESTGKNGVHFMRKTP